MTMPSERTRAVVYARDFLFRLSSPYLPDGYKKIPKAARDEARRLLRHFPTVVDLAYPEDSFDKAEAERLMGGAGAAGVNKIDTAAYSGDIVSRLRHWRGLHLAHSGTLFEEAATEIEVQRACTSAARDEIARLRELVDCLRAAIETAGFVYRNTDSGPNLVQP